jgi:hypothetical protein
VASWDRTVNADTYVSMSGNYYLTVTRDPSTGWVARVDRLAERTHAVSEPFGPRAEAQTWAVTKARESRVARPRASPASAPAVRGRFLM